LVKIRDATFIVVIALFQSMSVHAQWDEKYSTSIKIDSSNAISVWLRANFGKIGEIAAKRVDKILNDPRKQAKLSAKAIEYLYDLYNDNQNQKIKRQRNFLKLSNLILLFIYRRQTER
jgi:hypothetical protein